MKTFFSFLFSVMFFLTLNAQQGGIMETGGPLMHEQASYDVVYHDLKIQVFPDKKFIDGSLLMRARVINPLYNLVMDLDTTFTIESVVENRESLEPKDRGFKREEGKIWIDLAHTRQPGEFVEVVVQYSGNPREARHAPWDGGFSWKETSDGDHWIATTCQGEGADLWWPCKDHVSDEPDSMDLTVRVPRNLVAACNGKLVGQTDHTDSTTSYHWFISNPINIYNVALNIAPYELIEDSRNCIDGTTYPVHFYVLPASKKKGFELVEDLKKQLDFFERNFGPYPFRADKCAIVQTPHFGMEHQSIVAYGAGFRRGAYFRGKDWGFDGLLHHEMAHEWWGNLVTCADWKDAWIHEGFGTYAQAMYIEELHGKEGYYEYMRNVSPKTKAPIVHKTPQTASGGWSGSIYGKGARLLHTLRYVMGEINLKRSLRFMAYPDQSLEKISDGSQCRFVNTRDFINIAETYSEKDLDWIFDVYAYRTDLPKLIYEKGDKYIMISWDVPDGLYFPMPVEVKVDKKMYKLELKRGPAQLKVKKNSKIEIDPNAWLMFDLIEK